MKKPFEEDKDILDVTKDIIEEDETVLTPADFRVSKSQREQMPREAKRTISRAYSWAGKMEQKYGIKNQPMFHKLSQFGSPGGFHIVHRDTGEVLSGPHKSRNEALGVISRIKGNWDEYVKDFNHNEHEIRPADLKIYDARRSTEMNESFVLPVLTKAVNDFEKALKNHDVFYEYSDDHDVYRRGRRQRAEINVAFKQLHTIAPDKAKELYKKYIPYHTISMHGKGTDEDYEKHFNSLLNTPQQTELKLKEGRGDEDYFDDDDIQFADPGGRSALRAASKTNPRIHSCPTCGEENKLTQQDVMLGYQCDDCADRAERGF